MPLSNSVLRRYNAPTCTLQIVARNSPLSRWGGGAVTKLLQFDLRLDDPRMPEAKRVNIHGDRDQLEALHDAVTTYVQDLLKQSPDRFNAVVSAQAPPSSDGAETSRTLDLSAGDSQALSEEPRPLDSSDASAEIDLEQIARKDRTAKPVGEIFLQPGRGLSHELFLGPLVTEETGPVIHLSVLQVFDLATVLDEYAADVVPLPTLGRPRFAPALPLDWASIAAVLLVAVGLTTVAQLTNRSDSQQQTAQRSGNIGSSSNDQQPIALGPSPLEPLSSPKTLPPPPPVGSIVPSSSPSLPSVNVPPTTPALNGAPRANPPQTAPFISSARQQTAPQTTPVNPIPAITPPPPILINPVPSPNSAVSIPREAAALRTSGAPIPSSPVAPPSAAIPSPSPELTPFNSDLEPALSEATPDAAPQAESSGTAKTPQSLDSDLLREGKESTQARSRSTPTTPNDPKSTALNTVPQVAEIRDYFNKRWEPPASLNQPLEYILLLAVDGTIEQIMPLGQVARNYVDRTGMPLIGESFVSPNQSGQTPRVRVVLNPDGKVQTFLETEDSESGGKTGTTTDANSGAK